MSGERKAIQNPLFLDYSTEPASRLQYVIQAEYRPTGVVERPSPDLTVSQHPWWTEMGLKLPTGGFAVIYLLTVSDDWRLLAASIGETFEPFFKLMSGADHGDAVTKVVSQQWPETHAMLVRSSSTSIDGRVLGNVITRGGTDWIVADPIRHADLPSLPDEQVRDLIVTAYLTSRRATDPAELVVLGPALGGPNQLTRATNAFNAVLLSSGPGIGQTLEGGIDASEFLVLGQQVLNALSTFWKLKE